MFKVISAIFFSVDTCKWFRKIKRLVETGRGYWERESKRKKANYWKGTAIRKGSRAAEDHKGAIVVCSGNRSDTGRPWGGCHCGTQIRFFCPSWISTIGTGLWKYLLEGWGLQRIYKVLNSGFFSNWKESRTRTVWSLLFYNWKRLNCRWKRFLM